MSCKYDFYPQDSNERISNRPLCSSHQIARQQVYLLRLFARINVLKAQIVSSSTNAVNSGRRSKGVPLHISSTGMMETLQSHVCMQHSSSVPYYTYTPSPFEASPFLSDYYSR